MNSPRIVFLDSSTVDLGDIDLDELKKQGRYQSFKNTEPYQIVSRCRHADIVITNKCVLDKKKIQALPHLKLICVAATGIDNIDLETAKKQGITVKNVAGYSTTTVAEHTLLFMLAFSHRLFNHHLASMNGRWSRSPHFTLLDFPFSDLRGKTLGIIGYGKIGKQVTQLAHAFDMNVLVAKIPGRTYQSKRISLTQVLKKSDFVTLHCPLTHITHHLINSKTLGLMKKSAYLLNLARGPIVCDQDLINALKKDRIAGYATDLMTKEPPLKNHPFFQKTIRHKILMTPHIAWASHESRQRLIDGITQNIVSFLALTH